jgi:hypothetical protein
MTFLFSDCAIRGIEIWRDFVRNLVYLSILGQSLPTFHEAPILFRGSGLGGKVEESFILRIRFLSGKSWLTFKSFQDIDTKTFWTSFCPPFKIRLE